MGTELYQLYDGTIKLWGCKKLLWHRVALDETKMQVIPASDRHFPFAPNEQQQSNDDSPNWNHSAVDLSPMCWNSTNNELAIGAACQQLLEQLEKDGFALVRGTGIDPSVCRAALSATQAFLHNVDESVRKSCLSPTDRARRGYAPMNMENFASLLGEQGPNDLVRKFRMGPINSDGTQTLLQPNIWPNKDEWGQAVDFQAATESYYRSACHAANLILRAICSGLTQKYPELEKSLRPLLEPVSSQNIEGKIDPSQQTTSILTLLGYRDGTRHKGKNKGPLVAAHTDVGVITVLLYDGGNRTCASLQRRDGDGWVDVDLPAVVPDDPVFCVNVADCLSDLSGSRLPSTIHRVVANRQSKIPRNCCALFVGLDPACQLTIQGDTESISYEEWRRRRIARSQQVLRGHTSVSTVPQDYCPTFDTPSPFAFS
jgi:isopenicillin N synthase-like dioxygenase